MKKFAVFTLFAICMVSSCSSPEILFDRGEGVVSFACPEPYAQDTINLWYYIPEGVQADMTVQVVIHGNGRNADDMLRDWEGLADKYGIAILSPEFDAKQFPEAVFHQGNVMKDGQINPREDLVFGILNEAFKYFVEHSALKARTYNLFGHSAGAQFVHRFMQFGDASLVERAVSANSGWYTEPFGDIEYPYGQGAVKEVYGLNSCDYYAKDITFLLGTADTLRNGVLRKTPEADAQGLNRFERGVNCFDRAARDAAEQGCDFNWQISFAEGVGHDDGKMSQAAARVLYGE